MGALENLFDADALFRRGGHGARGVEADHVFYLGARAGHVGRGEVDLIDDRNHREVVVQRHVDVGQRLGLDALGGVDDQQRALAGGE